MSRRNSRFQKQVRRERRNQQKEQSLFIHDLSKQNYYQDGEPIKVPNRKDKRS